jgi:dTDP-4-amino-4,6-dideoxygalactose transaminase
MKSQKLAIDGGKPVRTKPLPLEFPGVHHMGKEEIAAVTRVMKSRSLFRYYGVDLGKEVESLENEFSSFVGAKYALGVSSGTGALHTALGALGVGPGQEVIVPAYMWVSVIAAVVNHGAIPVFADIDDSFCLNPADVERKITKKTSGIIMVHMSGSPGNARAIQKIARDHQRFFLEDCAQCAGGSIDGQRVGTFGDMGIFSFQMNKNMTAGEGGCVVSNDYRLYQRAFAVHDLGYARDAKGRLIMDNADLCLWGKGYRLDELRASVLRVQLKKLPAVIERMRSSKYRIREALAEFPQVKLRKIQDPQGDTGCFLLTTYPDAATAKRICEALRAEGVTTSPQGISNVIMTDWGLHLYSNNTSLVKHASVDGHGFPWKLAENCGLPRNYEKGALPVADCLFERTIVLPIPSCLTVKDENDIIQAFRKVLGTLLPVSGGGIPVAAEKNGNGVWRRNRIVTFFPSLRPDPRIGV